MPHHETVTLTGTVTHVFGHRFVVETAQGAVLADLTPHGAERVTLQAGATVELTGERKPSEIKVTRIVTAGRSIEIPHPPKHGPGHHKPGHHAPADPAIALQAARAAGFLPRGEPHRKPKHFELRGERDGEAYELHVELDGRIRKTRPLGAAA
jgi:hypothetical protein